MASSIHWAPLPEPAFNPSFLTSQAAAGLTPAQKDAIRTLIDWTQALTAVGLVVRTVAEFVKDEVGDPTARKVLEASTHALYDTIQATIQTLDQEIEAIKTGKAPVRVLPPIHIPPWDPNHDPANLFTLVWSAVLPVLELAYRQWGGDTTIGAVIWTMIVAGGKVTKDFEHYFPDA